MRAPSGQERFARRTSARRRRSSPGSRTSATPSAWRRSTRATSFTTAGRACSSRTIGTQGILLGDYLYAHGLVRIAALGDVRVVSDLAELISLCAQLRAEPAGPGGADAEAWAATAAALGHANGRLENARAALRDRGDPEPLARLAREEASPAAVADALRLHAERVL